MPDLPVLTLSQAHYDRVVASFPGATVADKTAAYKAWLTGNLIDYAATAEARRIDEAANASKAAKLAALAASLPTRPGEISQPAPQPKLDGGIFLNVEDYGALPDRRIDAGAPATATSGGTDNTAAFNAAIAALNALPAKDPARWHELTTTARPTLYIPAGRFNIGDLTPITVPGVRVLGGGKDATVLFHTGTTAAFTFGAFTTTPANPWAGAAPNGTFEELSIVQANEWHGLGLGFGAEGSRTRTAIVDNFGGGFYLHRIRVTGFKYGFRGEGSSDFTQIVDSEFNKCDVGVYCGPQTQQFRFSGVSFANCRESLVLDGVKQGSIRDCWFMDATETHISFESNTVSRTGVEIPGGEAHVVEIGTCWFEDAADTVPNRVAKQHIKFSSTSGRTPRFVHLHDNLVVAGGSLATKRAFVRVVNGTRLTIERTTVAGVLDWMVEQPLGAFTPIRMSDHRTVDGWAATPLWGDSSGVVKPTGWIGAVYEDSFSGRVDHRRDEANLESWTHDGAQRMKMTHTGADQIEFAAWISAAWRTRVTLDVNNSAVLLGDAKDAFVKRAGAGVVNLGKLAVTNTTTATTLGAVARRMEVFDAAGASLGFVPIYGTIT